MADTNYAAAVNYALEQKLDAPVAVTDEAQQREIQKQRELATLNQSVNNLIQERIAGKGRQYATQASTGLGSEINSEFESDMLNNPYTDNVVKWGKEATDAFYNEQQRGITERGLDVNTSLNRSFGDRVVDTSFGIAKNTEGIIADLVNAGVGLVNPEAGANLSKAHENFQNSLDQAITSDARQASRRLMADRQRIQKAVNKKLTEDDIASGTDEFTANLRASGREAMDTISNLAEDSDYMMEGLEMALGSYIPAAIVSGGIGAAGTSATRAITKSMLDNARNKLTQKALNNARKFGPSPLTDETIIAQNADRINKVLDRTSAAKNAKRVNDIINGKLGWGASIGLMEGGTAYSSINQDIMSASTKQLYENSLEFAQRVKELQDNGLDKAAAEKQVQVDLARSTAAKWATVAGVAGTAFGAMSKGTEKYIKHPWTAKGTLGDRAIKTPLFEALEEIPQEGGQNLYQNIAARSTIDKNKALYEGVGEGAVLGGFGGVAGAHAVAAPGILTSELSSTVKSTGKAVNTATAKVAEIRQEKDAIKAAEEQLKKSQESFGKLNNIITSTKDSIAKDTNLSDDEKATVNTYIDKTVAKAKLSAEEKTKLGITEDNRFKAISDIKKEIANTDDDTKLEELVNKYDALTDPVLETVGDAEKAELLISNKAKDAVKPFMDLISLVNPTEVTSKKAINTNKKILEIRAKRTITNSNLDFTKTVDYSDPTVRRDVNTAIAKFAIEGNIFEGMEKILPDDIDTLFSMDGPTDNNKGTPPTDNKNNNNTGTPPVDTNNTNNNTNNNTKAKPVNNTPSKEEQEKAKIRQNFARFLSTLPKETANAFVAAALASKMAALNKKNLVSSKKNKEGKRVSANILYMHKGDKKQLTEDHLSAEALVQDVIKAKLSGDIEGFNRALYHFGGLVTSQQNKYKALLESAKNQGSSKTYQTIGVNDESRDTPLTYIDSSKLQGLTNQHTGKLKHGRVWFEKKSLKSLENAYLMQNDLLALMGIANIMEALAFDKFSEKEFKVTYQPIFESPLDLPDIPENVRNSMSIRKSNYETYFKKAYERFFNAKYLIDFFNEIPGMPKNNNNNNNGGNNTPPSVPADLKNAPVTNPSIERYKEHNNPIVSFGFKVREKVNSIALGFKNPLKRVIEILSNKDELIKTIETMDKKKTVVHWAREERKDAYKKVLKTITASLSEQVMNKIPKAMDALIPADPEQLKKFNEDKSKHDNAFYDFFTFLDPAKNNKETIAAWNKKNPAPVAKNYGKTITIKEALLNGNIDFLDNRSAMNKLAFFVKLDNGNTSVNTTLLNAASLAVTQTLLSYNRRDRIVKDSDATNIFDLPQGASLDLSQIKYLKGYSYQELVDDIMKNLKRFLDINPNTDTNVNYSDGVLAGIADSFLRSALIMDIKGEFNYKLLTDNESKGKISLITKISIPGYPVRYLINPRGAFHEDTVLSSEELTVYRDGLTDLLSMEREQSDIYTENEKITVNKNYQNSPSDEVYITKEEEELLKKINKNVYRINPVTAGLMENTTNDFWHEVQGIAISEKAEKYGNTEDIENTRAKQKIHEYAMDDFHSFVEKAKEVAYETGKPLLEIGRLFSNRITLPGRVLQVGRATYVGNKTTRELFSNTPSTIDLKDNDMHQDVLTAALAQAFGVSIQNFDIADLREYIDKIRSSEAFERFRQRFSNDEKYKDTSWGIHPIKETKNAETGEITWENVDSTKKLDAEQGREIHQIMKELDIDTNKLSFMALMEILRYEEALKNDTLKNYSTMFYIEPDGITNGSANSRLLSSIGTFSARYVRLLGKVGAYLGKSAKTRKDIKDLKNQATRKKEVKKALQEYDDDIYTNNAKNIPNALKNFLNKVIDTGKKSTTAEEKEAVRDYYRAFNNLTTYVAWFGSGVGKKDKDDPSVDPEQSWVHQAFAYEFKRAFTKPFSQTLGYGIGLTSMSRNVVEDTKKNLYSFLTKVNIELNTNTAEYPAKVAKKDELNKAFLKCSDGKFDFDQFSNVFKSIINNKMVHISPLIDSTIDEERFYTTRANFNTDLGQRELDKLKSDFKAYSMSNDVISAMTQSLANSFGEVINQSAKETLGEGYLENLKKTVEATNSAALMYITVWRQKYIELTNGGLKAPTKDEIKALNRELKELLPVLHSRFHNFIAIKSETEKGNSILTQTGRGAEQTIVYNRINVPTLPGVSILPNGTIGMGDAVMMLLAYTKYGAEKMSDTYDGGQSALDVAEHNAYVLNRAVYDAMQSGNVFQASKDMLSKVREAFNSPEKLGLDSLDPVLNTFLSLYFKNWYKESINDLQKKKKDLSYKIKIDPKNEKAYKNEIKKLSETIKNKQNKLKDDIAFSGSTLPKSFLLKDSIIEPVFDFINQDDEARAEFKEVLKECFKTGNYTKARNLYAYYLNNYLISLEDSLQDSADSVEANHRAVERYGISINQMAGLSRDTVYHSDKDVTSDTPQEMFDEASTINTLNTYYAEELAKIKNKRGTTSIINADIKNMNKGVSVGFDTAITTLECAYKGTKIQHDATDEKVLQETLAIRGVKKEYKFTSPQMSLIKLISNCPAIKNNIANITFGSTKEAFEAFLKNNNIPYEGEVVTPFGGIHIRSKSGKSYIYVNVEGGKAEYAGINLLHEILHAATINIADMYFGEDHNKVADGVKPFIKAMRHLLMDFAKPGGVADELVAQLEHTSNPKKNQVVRAINQIKSALYPKDGSAPNIKKAFLEYIAIANTQESIVSYLKSRSINTKADEEFSLYQKIKNILEKTKEILLKLILSKNYIYVKSHINQKNLLDQVLFNTAGIIGASENILAASVNNNNNSNNEQVSFNPIKFTNKQSKKESKPIENDLNPEETAIITKNEPGIQIDTLITLQSNKKTKPEQLELPIQKPASKPETKLKAKPEPKDKNKDKPISKQEPEITKTTEDNKSNKTSVSKIDNGNPNTATSESLLGDLNNYCSTFLSCAYEALMGNSDLSLVDHAKIVKLTKTLTEVTDELSTVFNLTEAEKEAFSKIFISLHLDYNFNTSAKVTLQEICNRALYNNISRIPSPAITAFMNTYFFKEGKAITPAFIALAIINKDIKEELAHLIVEGPEKSENRGKFNQLLDNFGYSSLYNLMNYATKAGASKNSFELMYAALSSYYQSGIKQSRKRLFLEGLSNKINNALADAAESLSDKVKDTFATDNPKNLINSFSKLQNTLLKGAPLGEVIHIYNNILQVPEGIRSLISDLIGNTSKDVDINNLLKLSKVNAQQLREQFRNDIPRVLKRMINKGLTEDAEKLLYEVSKIDIGCLTSLTSDEIIKLFTDTNELEDSIYTLEQELKAHSEAIKKSKQLAHYMLTGEIGHGMLYRNATLISIFTTKSDKLADKIDQLTTLYAIKEMGVNSGLGIKDILADNKEYFKAILGNLAIVRQNELKRADINGRLNQRKGFMPTSNSKPGHYIMAPVSDTNRLKQYGYIKVADYPLTKYNKKVAYFYSDLPRNTTFSEGVTQTASNTTMGVRNGTGFTTDLNAGFVLASNSSKATITNLTDTINKVTQGKEGYIPIFQVVYNPAIEANEYKLVGYEMAVDRSKLNFNNPTTDIADMIGIALGRDVEEKIAKGFRSQAIKLCHELYEKAADKASFINVYESKDPIIKDSLKVLDQSFEDELQQYTWKEVKSTKEKPVLMIRRSEIKQVLGERNASIRDFWSGNTRWPESTQKAVRNALIAVLGTKAFTRAAKTEAFVQSATAYARNTIVVKSIEVCMINMGCNIFQMNSLGIPFHKMPKLIMEKYVEMKKYMKIQKELMETRAQLGVYIDNPEKLNVLNSRIKALNAQIKELTIAPLIEAGEFSTVTDAGTRPEEIEFMSGKLGEWIEQKVNTLPEGVKKLGEQVFMTKNTALYRILEEATQFQDFITKAIVYDHVKAEKIKAGEYGDIAKKQALAEIREEFVDYDKLAGRDRQYLENIGMLWFYNYKLRIIKSAVRNIRRNPFNTLVAFGVINALGLPMGLPITDNLFAKILSGDALITVGPQMGLDSWKKLPAFNLIF